MHAVYVYFTHTKGRGKWPGSDIHSSQDYNWPNRFSTVKWVHLCFQTQRLQRELRAEHELTQRELQESSRRLRQECDHRVALEREKVRLMEEERARLLQQVEIEDWICLTDSDCKVKWLLLFFSLCSCCADCRWWVSVQTAGERVPAVQRTTEHQTRVQTAVRDQPAHPREGKAAALGIVQPGKTVLIIMKLKSKE